MVVGALDRRVETEDAELVLRVSLVELLPAGLSDRRMRRHVDPRLSAVAPGQPRALSAGDVPARIEFGGLLAEVPDVARAILRVPVGRALAEVAAQVEPVAQTVASKPRIVRVACVTVTMSRDGRPSLTPL
jgi:hypothetical protein